MKGCKDCASRKKCIKNQWDKTFSLSLIYNNESVCDKFNTNHYGIWNGLRKEFQFGIDEPTEVRAFRELHKKIGYDSYKWRFEAKQLPKEMWKRIVTRKE